MMVAAWLREGGSAWQQGVVVVSWRWWRWRWCWWCGGSSSFDDDEGVMMVLAWWRWCGVVWHGSGGDEGVVMVKFR
ncbi:hypothetical protein Tco_0036200 [Tanacetum coccineum]